MGSWEDGLGCKQKSLLSLGAGELSSTYCLWGPVLGLTDELKGFQSSASPVLPGALLSRQEPTPGSAQWLL